MSVTAPLSASVELAANFDDIDIDRDGRITANTWAELTGYIDAIFR